MDHVALVEAEEDAGRSLVEALDRIDLPSVAALWMYFSEHGEWRLVIGVDAAMLERKGGYHGVYVKISEVLGENPDIKKRVDLSRVKVVSSNDALIQALKNVVRFNGLDGVRFSNNSVNGIFIEDALIYRMAA